jgi:hypothetical protein
MLQLKFKNNQIFSAIILVAPKSKLKIKQENFSNEKFIRNAEIMLKDMGYIHIP